ncbi:MAG: hypothetical protein PHW11_03210 [Anaerolineaceae bacterium]|nr:hypothetical protein [Anaerolineaceae bacterium]MDD4042415.1 hypothetical protein [Anaerolineaceae bacterium]MDD4578044.1 hypothetical protein [Anaerolineaceae bacterium]
MKKDMLQAYKQAPWRTQVQWVGIFLLVVVALATVAGLYLFISGRSAATGRRIQNLESELVALHRQNNDLETLLGEIRSERALSERIDSMNMRPLTPNEALYLEVPGYVPAEGPSFAPPPSVIEKRTPVLLPEFTSTFLEWISSKLQEGLKSPTPTSEVLP